MTKRIKKTDLKVIRECLSLGIALEKQSGYKTRRFARPEEITDQIERGAVRTTHMTEDMRAYIWITVDGIEALAAQARAKLARKGEILAEQQRRHDIAMGHA